MVGTGSFLGSNSLFSGAIGLALGRASRSLPQRIKPSLHLWWNAARLKVRSLGSLAQEGIVDDHRPLWYMFYGMFCLGDCRWLWSISWIHCDLFIHLNILQVPYWLCLWSDFNHRSFLIITWTGLGYLTRGKGKSGYQFETAKWRPYFAIKFWTMSRITIVSCCIHFRKRYLWSIMNLLKMEISSHEFVKKTEISS